MFKNKNPLRLLVMRMFKYEVYKQKGKSKGLSFRIFFFFSLGQGASPSCADSPGGVLLAKLPAEKQLLAHHKFCSFWFSLEVWLGRIHVPCKPWIHREQGLHRVWVNIAFYTPRDLICTLAKFPGGSWINFAPFMILSVAHSSSPSGCQILICLGFSEIRVE